MNKTYYNINVAIIGSVSSGKSTFINALFSKFYSETKMTRTTMCPQIYMESDKSDENIYETSVNANAKLSGKISSIRDLFEIKHNIHNNENMMYNSIISKSIDQIGNLVDYPCKKNLRINFHDLPGLNDVETRNIYYEYVKNKFHKYDIIIYIIDIKSALNTSDEADILNLVFEQIELNKTKYGIVTKLIILINKCDKMIIEGDSVILDYDNSEYTELYKQILRVIKDKNMTNLEYSIVPISCENAFIYNMIINSPEKLSDAQMNKIGIDFFGGIYWKKLECEKKRERIVNYMNDINNIDIIKSNIINSGFFNFKQAFNKLFSDDKYLEFVLNGFKIDFTEEISRLTFDPIKNEYDNFITMIERINLIMIGVNDFFDEVFEVFNINKNNFKKEQIFIDIKNVIRERIQTLITILENSKYYSEMMLKNNKEFVFDKINFNIYSIVKDDSPTQFKMTASNIRVFRVKLENFIKNCDMLTIENINTFLVNITIGNNPKFHFSQTSIDALTSRIYTLCTFRIKSIRYIEDLCNIYYRLDKLSICQFNFEINVCSNIMKKMLNHIIVSSCKLIEYLATDKFNIFKLCKLLNILNTNKIDFKNYENKIIKSIFVNSQSLTNGETVIYGTEEQINTLGGGTNKITHSNINNIIDYFKKKYNFREYYINSIMIKIIINMYRHILKTNSLAFISNNKSLLFQMDKFWNGLIITDPTSIVIYKKKILEIQYLAHCAKKIIYNNTYQDFIFDELVLENKIKSRITPYD